MVLAFMHEPALVIMDEPTSGLDPLHQQEFYGIVRDARARGATAFISSVASIAALRRRDVGA